MVEDTTGRTYDLMNELTLLNPETVRFYRDGFEDLYLRDGDAEPLGPLTLQRAFPVNWADEFISVRSGGDEVGLVRRLAELDPDSRGVVADELAWTYFTATITAVHAIEVRFHVPHWDVDTDRGPRAFDLRGTRTDLRVLPGGRVLVRDADGNRYEIPDLAALDPASRAIVEDHI